MLFIVGERIGVIEENPRKDAIDCINAINEVFVAMQLLESGPELMLYHKYETPSLRKLRSNFNFCRKFARKIVDEKIDDLKHELESPNKLLEAEGWF